MPRKKKQNSLHYKCKKWEGANSNTSYQRFHNSQSFLLYHRGELDGSYII